MWTGCTIEVAYFRRLAASTRLRRRTAAGVTSTSSSSRMNSSACSRFINRGGIKFHPGEIEELLLRHPAIREAAIVPMPDPRLGERACLYAVVNDGSTIELKDVIAYLLKLNNFPAGETDLPTDKDALSLIQMEKP